MAATYSPKFAISGIGCLLFMLMITTDSAAQLVGGVERRLVPTPWWTLPIENGSALGVTFAPTNDRLVVWTSKHQILVWDFEDDNTETIDADLYRQESEHIHQVIPLSDGRIRIVSKSYFSVSVWETGVNEALFSWRSNVDWMNSADISADGRMLALATSSTANKYSQVEIVDLDKRDLLQTFRISSNSPNGVTAVRFSNDSQQLAIAWGPVIRRYAVDSGRKLATYATMKATVDKLIWEPEGKYLAAICGTQYLVRSEKYYALADDSHIDLRVHILNGQTDEDVTTLGGNEKPIRSIAFFPSSTGFLREAITTGGVDKIRWWNVENGGVIHKNVIFGNGNESYEAFVALSNDGSLLVVAEGLSRHAISIYTTDRELMEAERESIKTDE